MANDVIYYMFIFFLSHPGGRLVSDSYQCPMCPEILVFLSYLCTGAICLPRVPSVVVGAYGKAIGHMTNPLLATEYFSGGNSYICHIPPSR